MRTDSPFRQKQAAELSNLKAFAYFVQRMANDFYSDERTTTGHRAAIYSALDMHMPSAYQDRHDNPLCLYCQDVIERLDTTIKEREEYCKRLGIECEARTIRTLFARAESGFQMAKELGFLKIGANGRG